MSFELSDIQRKCLKDISALRTIMQEGLNPMLDGPAKPLLEAAGRAEATLAKQFFFVRYMRSDKLKPLTDKQKSVVSVWSKAELFLAKFIKYYDAWEKGHKDV